MSEDFDDGDLFRNGVRGIRYVINGGTLFPVVDECKAKNSNDSDVKLEGDNVLDFRMEGFSGTENVFRRSLVVNIRDYELASCEDPFNIKSKCQICKSLATYLLLLRV